MNPRTPPPPPPRPATVQSNGSYKIGRPKTGQGQRLLIYGPGGIGKTTLAMAAPNPVFIDLDDSLASLTDNCPVVEGITTWADLRGALQRSDLWPADATVIIDSITKGEELAVAHTLATVPHEKGNRIQRLEDYGYGKGYQHVYETFLGMLADLDAHIRAGRNVIFIAHDCTANVPNPEGDDWIRYEPRLQSPTSGKSSIRLRIREWCDYVFFIGYDIVAKDGKAIGSGTRTLYPTEMPHCMAKHRTHEGRPEFDTPMEILKGDTTLWNLLFAKGETQS